MKRKGKICTVILMMFLVIFGLGSYWVYNRFLKPASGWTNLTESWVDKELQAWQPTQNSSIIFGNRLGAVSYSNVMQSYNDIGVIDAELNGSIQLGVKVVRIDLNYDPFLQNNTDAIGKYDHVIQQIKLNGMKVMIADSAAESYWNNKLSWNDFVTAIKSREAFLSARYLPDYYIVIKEPGWYYGMINYLDWPQVTTSATDWIQLADSLAQIVKNNSIHTEVGVSVSADSLYHEKGSLTTQRDFLVGCSMLNDIDLLGYDIYTVLAFNDTQTFLHNYPTTGKENWILETWSGGDSEIFNVSRSTLDVKFMQLIYDFALKFNMTGIIPFYSSLFFSYETLPTNTKDLLEFYQNRTDCFREYHFIIQSAH
jgi:hypothetical protein